MRGGSLFFSLSMIFQTQVWVLRCAELQGCRLFSGQVLVIIVFLCILIQQYPQILILTYKFQQKYLHSTYLSCREGVQFRLGRLSEHIYIQYHHIIRPYPYWLLNSQKKNTPKTMKLIPTLISVVQIIFSCAVQRFQSRCTPYTSRLKFLFYSSKQQRMKGMAKYLNSTSYEKDRQSDDAPSHRINLMSFSQELTICLKRKWKANAQARHSENLKILCLRTQRQMQNVQWRLSSTMKGWIRVYFYTQMIETDSMKRQAASECLDMYILWKKAVMELMYSPKVMGRLQKQKRDKQSN